MSAATAGPLRAAADLADRLLRPQAERVDVAGVPRSALDAVAAAGLLGLGAPADAGGAGCSPATVREVTEVLAGACGSTWFVTAQHAQPLLAVLAARPEQRARHLPGLVSGRTLAGVAFAHLRRPGPPAVTATRTAGGWRFAGSAPWVTGWGLVDLLLLHGLSPEGDVVAALVPARDADGVRATPLRLAAMQATRTVRLDLAGLSAPDDDVVLVTPAGPWREADALRTVNAGPHTFGLQAEVLRRLAETGRAPELVAHLDGERRRLRGAAYRLLDEVPPHERVPERLALRAEALELGVRCTTALVTASGGSALSLAAAPQRLAREALFHLVQAQTAPVRDAVLRVLGDR